MPLIIPTNSISAVGYNVDNSLRFNSGSSDYLNRTPASAGNRTTWTWSAWDKLVNSSGFNPIFMAGDFTNSSPTGQNGTGLLFLNGQFYSYWDSGAGASVTSARYRDPSAWYHIVLQANTSTLKLYVNSVEQTSKSISGNGAINYTSIHTIGTYPNIVDYLNGYMAEVVFIDGQALDPTSFGEFDEDTGIWKPIDVSGLTFGTNGFYLDFENSGSLGADVSGNGNNFTVNNLTSIDQTTDTPTNNYCTLNPLDNYYAGSTFSEGNLKISTGGSNTTYNTSTFGLTQGKWYWEYKFTGTTQQYMTGIASKLSNATSDVLGYQHAEEYALNQSGSGIYSNSVTTNYGSGNLASGDIISVALDLDNNNLYFAKNGQWGSGSAWDQTFSSALAYSITDPSSTTLGAYFVAVGEWNSSGTSEINMNFGNPSFTISSGNSDANGYGNFEYAVPSGYYSLNTKNLAEFG